MIARFNPTGTHIHKGFLKIRLDLFPEPMDKTYPQQYVGGQLNSCLCHFLIVDTSITAVELASKIAEIFSANTVRTLDDALSADNTVAVSQIMQTKIGTGNAAKGNLTKIVTDANKRLTGLEVVV